jgi:hypothetical protein
MCPLPAWFLRGSCSARLSFASVRDVRSAAARHFAVLQPRASRVVCEWCAKRVAREAEFHEPDS